jgi:uncharacterized membrane protein required for colicin V production
MSSSPIDKFLDGISNQSICTFFYYMYIIALLSAIIQFGLMSFNIIKMKNKVYALFLIILFGAALSIGVFQTLFLYSLCNRSIVSKDK